MFDIGIGELLALAVLGLIVFGPEKLPKAAADAGRWARQIRQMASSARQEIADSAGIDLNETMGGLKEFRDLHPRRLAAGIFDDEADGQGAGKSATNERTSAAPKQQAGQTFDPDLT